MCVVDPTNIAKAVLKEEFEDTKRVNQKRISYKNRQHNGQQKKYKQRSTKQTHKTKGRVIGTLLITRDELYYHYPCVIIDASTLL